MSRETDEQKCRRKLRHLDYLSALLHARSLAEPNLVIYPCSICGGLHVGHDRRRYTAHCDRERVAKITGLERRIRMHEHLIAERTAIVQRLKRKLEAVMIFYDSGA